MRYFTGKYFSKTQVHNGENITGLQAEFRHAFADELTDAVAGMAGRVHVAGRGGSGIEVKRSKARVVSHCSSMSQRMAIPWMALPGKYTLTFPKG